MKYCSISPYIVKSHTYNRVMNQIKLLEEIIMTTANNSREWTTDEVLIIIYMQGGVIELGREAEFVYH